MDSPVNGLIQAITGIPLPTGAQLAAQPIPTMAVDAALQMESSEMWRQRVLQDTWKWLALLREDPSMRFVRFGIPEIDAGLSGGLPRGAVTTLLGGPGSGKSSLAMLAAINWVLQDYPKPAASVSPDAPLIGHPTVVFSLELSRRDVITRMAALRSGKVFNRFVPWADIRDGINCDPLNEFIGIYGREEVPLYFQFELPYNNDQLTRMVIVNQCRYLREKYKENVFVVVDYIQDAAAASNVDARIGLEQLLLSLRVLAKEGDTLLILSSTTRGKVSKFSSRRPPNPEEVISAGKESGRLEFDSAVLMGIFKSPREVEGGWAPSWLTVAKHRYGNAPVHVPLEFNGASGLFRSRIDPRGVTDLAAAQKLESDPDNALILSAIKTSDVTSAEELGKLVRMRKEDVLIRLEALKRAGLIKKWRKQSSYKLP